MIRPAVGHTVLNNCVLWDNTAPLGPEIALIGDFPAELFVVPLEQLSRVAEPLNGDARRRHSR